MTPPPASDNSESDDIKRAKRDDAEIQARHSHIPLPRGATWADRWIGDDPAGTVWRTFNGAIHPVEIPAVDIDGQGWVVGGDTVVVRVAGIQYADGTVQRWVRVGDQSFPAAGLRSLIAVLSAAADEADQ